MKSNIAPLESELTPENILADENISWEDLTSSEKARLNSRLNKGNRILDVKVNPLDISSTELIPAGCKNCHSLRSGMKPGSFIFIGKTTDKTEWIICLRPRSQSKKFWEELLRLEQEGIDPDKGQTATKAKLVNHRGHWQLIKLLEEMKDPALDLNEEKDGDDRIIAYRLEI